MKGKSQELIAFLLAQDKDKVWELKAHRERRSLDSNSYYWALVSKLAQKLGMSTARVHNLMLRECAPPYLIDDQMVMELIPDTDEAERQVLESETYHLKPTSGVIMDRLGKVRRWYILLRGASSFNSVEMNTLIERAVEECKAQGIETATPEELEQMRALWEMRHAQADERNSNKGKRKESG